MVLSNRRSILDLLVEHPANPTPYAHDKPLHSVATPRAALPQRNGAAVKVRNGTIDGDGGKGDGERNDILCQVPVRHMPGQQGWLEAYGPRPVFRTEVGSDSVEIDFSNVVTEWVIVSDCDSGSALDRVAAGYKEDGIVFGSSVVALLRQWSNRARLPC